MMMAYFHCYATSPPSKYERRYQQYPAQGGITVEGDFEEVDEDSVRSDSLSVCQRADGVCQLLHRGLNS